MRDTDARHECEKASRGCVGRSLCGRAVAATVNSAKLLAFRRGIHVQLDWLAKSGIATLALRGAGALKLRNEPSGFFVAKAASSHILIGIWILKVRCLPPCP
jgi:hypothetical protein